MREKTKPIKQMDRDELEKYTKQLEEQTADPGMGRRSFIAKAVGIAGAGAFGIYSVDLASAAPSGTFPAETDDPLLKSRVDRIRYIARSSAPSAPGSGRILAYVDGGDLP